MSSIITNRTAIKLTRLLLLQDEQVKLHLTRIQYEDNHMNQSEDTQVSQDDGTHRQVPYEDSKAVPCEDNKVSCNGCKVELHLDEDVEE